MSGDEAQPDGSGRLRDLLPFSSDRGTATGVETPPRVLAISVFALAVAAVAALLRPAGDLGFAGFLWILALIPAFLLSFYQGWSGAVRALAGGMAVLTATEVAVRLLLDGQVDWWIYGGATTGLIAVSLGSGAMAEVFHRTGGGPGTGTWESQGRQELRRAVEEGQLALHFQPVVDLQTRSTVGVEALLRWDHPRRGLLSASEFIEFAEGVGMLAPIGDWAMDEAFRQFSRWRRNFPSSPDFFVGLNVSTPECRQPGFVDRVRELLEAHGVEPGQVQLEVDEETLDQAGTQLAQLERMGVSVVVDDFGTGYVSVGQLARLEVDGLKVDGSFVSRMEEDERDRATVDAIVRLGRALGLRVTAEGIEREAQLTRLRELGCDLGQGSFFADPYPATALDAGLPPT